MKNPQTQRTANTSATPYSWCSDTQAGAQCGRWGPDNESATHRTADIDVSQEECADGAERRHAFDTFSAVARPESARHTEGSEPHNDAATPTIVRLVASCEVCQARRTENGSEGSGTARRKRPPRVRAEGFEGPVLAACVISVAICPTGARIGPGML